MKITFQPIKKQTSRLHFWESYLFFFGQRHLLVRKNEVLNKFTINKWYKQGNLLKISSHRPEQKHKTANTRNLIKTLREFICIHNLQPMKFQRLFKENSN